MRAVASGKTQPDEPEVYDRCSNQAGNETSDKAAKTETGLVVQVPPFICEGESVLVNTADGSYQARA